MTAVAAAPSPSAVYPAGTLALSPEQCAKALNLTRTKIFALLASGQLRSVKLGRYRRIPVAEVEAFLIRELEAQSA